MITGAEVKKRKRGKASAYDIITYVAKSLDTCSMVLDTAERTFRGTIHVKSSSVATTPQSLSPRAPITLFYMTIMTTMTEFLDNMRFLLCSAV